MLEESEASERHHHRKQPFMMDRILAKVILLVVLPTSVSAWTKREDTHGKTIIAYYASWLVYIAHRSRTLL